MSASVQLPYFLQNLIAAPPDSMAQLAPNTPVPTPQPAPAQGLSLADFTNMLRGGTQTPSSPGSIPQFDDSGARNQFSDLDQVAPPSNKANKLVQFLQRGLAGAASGMAANAQTYAMTGRNAGFGGGLGAGFTQALPYQQAVQAQQLQRGNLENQLFQVQLQTAPLLQWINLLKSNADIGKSTAEANKANAEAGAIPTKEALERAQALAANYKEVGGMLYDVSGGTPQPVAGQTAPLDPDEAAILGKQPGDQVPMQIKNQVNEIKQRGIRSVQAGGRSLLVDSRGNTIKDMGAATPMAVVNAQMGAFGNPASPEVQAIVDQVGTGKMDLPTALSSMRRNPAAAASFMGALLTKYPDYNQATYGAQKGVLDYFTSGEGAKSINAFNTATEHLNQLQTLATALDNQDNQTYNQFKNSVQTWLGGAAPTNFNAVKNAVVAEVGKTFKGTVTDGEIESIQKNISSAQSPAQMKGFIDQALALMRSKMGANYEQFQAGMQGQPAFPNSGGNGISVTDPRGGVHVFPDQKSADAFKKAAHIQ